MSELHRDPRRQKSLYDPNGKGLVLGESRGQKTGGNHDSIPRIVCSPEVPHSASKKVHPCPDRKGAPDTDSAHKKKKQEKERFDMQDTRADLPAHIKSSVSQGEKSASAEGRDTESSQPGKKPRSQFSKKKAPVIRGNSCLWRPPMKVLRILP